MNYLGRFLKKRLKELKMSEREVALKCGLSHSYLNQLIKGINPSTNKKISPTLSTFEKLAKGFEVDIEHLQKVARGCLNKKVKCIEEKASNLSNKQAGSDNYPEELIQQIKDFQEFMKEIGINKAQKSSKEWDLIISNIKEILKNYDFYSQHLNIDTNKNTNIN